MINYLLLLACSPPPGPTPEAAAGIAEQGSAVFHDTRELMGTWFSVSVSTSPARQAQAEAAMTAALDEVARIENLMSSWKPESQLGRVNAQAGGEPVRVDAELLELVQRSVGYCELSGRRFDPTFKPLGTVWDFRADPFIVPDDERIAAAQALVDCRKIEIDPLGGTLRLPERGMGIGLGAIAKGYAVDRASKVLVDAGFGDSIVDGGGDVFARGRKQSGPWTAGIQHPRAPRGELMGTLHVENRAVVTSGDYERFVEVDGVRYHHIIDVRTGHPVDHTMAVTALADSAERADALSTTLFVLGPEDAWALLGTLPDVDALIVGADGETRMTEGMTAALLTR